MPLTESQIERYSRQIILPEVGGRGQEKLLGASVLVVGAGGLGSAAALYLAAAGVGKLVLVDDDRVEISNLHRQVLYSTGSVGVRKADAARESLGRLNPDCDVRACAERFEGGKASDWVRASDVAVDCSDNFPTRFLLNDLCVAHGKPLVSGSVLRFDGQVSTYLGFTQDSPCYRCVFVEPPPPGLYPADDECGVFGTVAGLIGALQATEVLKLLLGVGTPLTGRLLIYDGRGAAFREVALRKAPDCSTCAPARAAMRAAG